VPRSPRRSSTWSTAASAAAGHERSAALIGAACVGLEKHVDADAILAETVKNLYDGVPVEELHKSAILAARALMEKDPAYSQVTARILLHTIRKEVFGKEVPQAGAAAEYITYFPQYIAKGIEAELLDEELGKFDLSAWPRRSSPTATCSSATSACRPCTTATSCTSAKPASRCRRPSTCASRWACPCAKKTAKSARSSSTTCCRASTS
jgi:hypothetical protein